ncbi:cellulose binding domain-containing protein [Glycomyces salinus]|uniref:cellulose binding domain-containing protein n=1 Tax=Glycomyces salinus TaxID=980294 RepID=UPI0018EC66E8|nr:cellulose binding domain-containing protein [Glycomyces salinus]
MRSWKARWKDRPSLLRGRLHGRALKALGGLAVAALAIAVWQLAAALGGGDDVGSGGGELSDPLFSPIPDESSDTDTEAATDTATPSDDGSPTAEESTPETEEQTEAEEPDPEDSEETGPGCTAALHLDSEWGDTISVTVEVVNTGEEGFDGWEVVLALEDVDITATWGMEHVEGDRYGNGWVNGDLDPGESAEPSFNGSAAEGYSLPATVPCAPD